MHKEAAIREPLILGHKTYHDITEDVCKPIEDKAPRMWYILFSIAAILGLYGVGCILYLLGTGSRYMGTEQDCWMGVGHHELRMVGRYWSRRNTDFCGTFTFPSEMENGD